jgi:hypothetical protein
MVVRNNRNPFEGLFNSALSLEYLTLIQKMLGFLGYFLQTSGDLINYDELVDDHFRRSS